MSRLGIQSNDLTDNVGVAHFVCYLGVLELAIIIAVSWTELHNEPNICLAMHCYFITHSPLTGKFISSKEWFVVYYSANALLLYHVDHLCLITTYVMMI